MLSPWKINIEEGQQKDEIKNLVSKNLIANNEGKLI